jgi:hypothetical protein
VARPGHGQRVVPAGVLGRVTGAWRMLNLGASAAGAVAGGALAGIVGFRAPQHQRLEHLFAGDAHVQVEAIWGVYHRMITAYRQPDPARGREQRTKVIDALSHGVPKPLT